MVLSALDRGGGKVGMCTVCTAGSKESTGMVCNSGRKLTTGPISTVGSKQVLEQSAQW